MEKLHHNQSVRGPAHNRRLSSSSLAHSVSEDETISD
jgi:hypothetical protein